VLSSLFWAASSSCLFSGSFDKSAAVWSVTPATAARRSVDAGKPALGRTLARDTEASPVTARLVGRFRGHTDKVKAVVYAPDVRRVFTAGDDRTIIVWDSESGKAVSTTRAHTGKIISLKWIPARRWLVSASHDRTIKVWSFAGRGL
jgi:WD40 repeat protein